ncbi:MAG: MaoC family dehydratase [Chloroflexota bacterium]|nr:MaoC family dehydratase [Chloroflexota bacterium]
MCEIQLANGAPLVEPLSAEQIQGMPLYEWEIARIGDTAPPLTVKVTEQIIANYCAAVRNDNPLYLDRDVARRGAFGGIIAPPTFVFMCAPQRRNEVMHACGYASPEEKADRATPYAKAEVFFHRPIRPGDEITSVVRLDDKYERRGSQFMTWRVNAHNALGESVVEYTYTIIWRQAPNGQNDTPAPTDARAAAESRAAPAGASALVSVTKIESQEAIDQYAELTRVRVRTSHHSLHSDPEFARRTIFGGTVNMGVATAAYCSEVIERAHGPGALLQPGARLEYKGIRPIRAGYQITVGGYEVVPEPGRRECQLAVHNREGTLCGVASATLLN